MLNAERYRERLLEINGRVGISKQTGEPRECDDLACTECMFEDMSKPCSEFLKEWMLAKYIPFNWATIPKDTPLDCRIGGMKCIRYFSGKCDNEGNPMVYPGGRTSLTASKHDILVAVDEVKIYENDKLAK